MNMRPPIISSRSWLQRLLIAFNGVLVVMCLVAASIGGYLYYRFGQVPRISFDDGVLAEQPLPGEAQNYLLVGSDSRAFVEAGSADEGAFGNTSDAGSGSRADTIIVVRIDPRSQKAAMLSFPRDLWVPIAGTGGSQRINTALSGGPQRLIDTIREDFGISVNHYAQVNFQGFKELVDAIGGVTVYLARPVRDHDTTVSPPKNQTGLQILQTGCLEMNGTQGLAYVRSRHFQTLEADGHWHSDGRGDFGRVSRQQDFIRRAVKQALAKGLLNPIKLNRLMTIGTHSVDISDTLKVGDILELGRSFGTLAPGSVQQYTLPVVNSTHNGAATLDIPAAKQAEAEAIFAVFRGVAASPTDPIAPSAVTVRVLNGSGRLGEAANVTIQLGDLGFGTATAGSTTRSARTVVRYPPGQEAKAQTVARYIEGASDLQEVAGVSGVDVVLVTGSDFTGVRAVPLPETAVTTTTTSTPTTATTEPEPDC